MAKPSKVSGRHINVEINFGEANPKQALFYQSKTLYTAYGGARGGGKTHAVRIKAIGGAIRYPGIKILIIRRTYPELQSNHIEPILKLVPNTIATYNGTMHTMYFVNGSTIHFGHYQGAASELEYQGQEYDWIFMDEATQFMESEFRILGGLLRGVNDIPKRFYLTCNPGGIGHKWVKRLFIDRDFKTGSDNPEENENPDDYNFIFASVEDNTHLMESSPQYVQMLASLPEKMRRAHRYGDWDALSGNYFSEFSEKHIIRPCRIEPWWLRYRTIDYGLDMLACYWVAVDERGRCFVYRELKKSNLVVSDAAKLILDCTLPNEYITMTFAPPDLWSRTKDSGKTMAEMFAQNGVPLVKASNNRIQGHMQVKQMLTDLPDGKPGLVFFEDCKGVIDDLRSIQADENNPNDCAKQPHEITHSVDSIRYFCVSRTLSTEKPDNSADIDEDEDEEDYDEFMTGGNISRGYMEF